MRIILVILFCAILVSSAPGQKLSAKTGAEAHSVITVKSFGKDNVIGNLGYPLGTVVRVAGVSTRGGTKADSEKIFLQIDTVNGKRLERPVEFPFYRAASEIKKPHPGKRFDYDVHEYGIFDGVVERPGSLDAAPMETAYDRFQYRPRITIHKSNVGGSDANAQKRQGKIVTKQTTSSPQDSVEMLVLKKSDIFVKEGVQYQSAQSARRINAAIAHLISLGKQSWPTLFAHLDDKRPTMSSRETTGPHQVCHNCYDILRRQITSYPRGYPPSKLSPEYQLDDLFQPSIKDWLLQRRIKSLLEIQIETLRHVITIER